MTTAMATATTDATAGYQEYPAGGLGQSPGPQRLFHTLLTVPYGSLITYGTKYSIRRSFRSRSDVRNTLLFMELPIVSHLVQRLPYD
jgi:hypothetical protein